MVTSGRTVPINHLLAAFAHPDDEAFCCGGLFAALTDQGTNVTLICATRGESGEILIPSLATRETLGMVREGELRTAMEHVGVSDIRFLDYIDSGMIGTPENDAERAFMRAPEEEVVTLLLPVIEELRPEVVITFGPDGFYGHPDHLAIYRATTAAVLASDQPITLYYATAPRERFIEMSSRPNNPFIDFSDEELNRMGTPRQEITTFVNARPWLERKRATMAAHRTQFGDEGPLNRLSPDEVDAFLSTEYFVRVPRPWDNPSEPFDPLSMISRLVTSSLRE